MPTVWVDWFPIVFFPLKFLVLGLGMFFAIKSHRDGERRERAEAERAAAEKLAAAEYASQQPAESDRAA